MLQTHLDFFLLRRKKNLSHLPRPFENQELRKDIDVAHAVVPP
jgi:hypothetical protein